ncbi:Cell surface protein [Methanosarcina siciliae T4/M]|uniref:Cell surface protein n=1 Tax=Methanosarcina siciliae T4/M TaxID=1434120 RepID=A0A0E3P363_9EURY|nr:PGF-pre-PGF domain-containing protein [Methanosarcina siciliae]AKB27893.1 Cell surface protein [Methanosarcina siciliae T4/M]
MWKMNKELSSLFILIFALQVFAGSAAATTIYVDSDGSGNYTTVQDALDNAVDGNTIIVRPGNYDEDLAVDVSVTLIGSSGYPTVGKIEVNRQSQISGLTITGGVRFEQAGMSCIIRNNKFDECGVSIGNNYACGNQTIIDNLFTDSPIGVFTYDSIDNKITGNTFQNCHTGIELTYGIGRHVVKDNTFQDCDVGIRLIEDSATIYNNYFSSDINLVLEDDGDARLNTTKTAGTNIIDGPYIGGNFWGSPSGDGFSQTHPDTNGDGIAEEEYQVDEGVIDYLPLVTPRTEPEPVLPIANFRANTTHGNAPLSVLFTDTSQNATGLSWDVNGDGVEDSNAASFAYTYTSRGTYEAKLTVSNANGTDTETAVITVMEEEIPILPVANFTVNKTSGYYPLNVLFTDTSQNATGLSWDVNGDGVEDSNAASFAYTYTSRGTYEAKLTVSNANGTDTETAVITVMEEEIPILPVANFTVNKTSGYYPLTILFTDTSQNATGLSWDVNGDGVEDSNAASFAYTYTSRGTYEAKLTVSNANGTDTETAVITVMEEEIPILPVANFTVNKTSGYYPLTVLFTDTSQNATGLSWDVNGDGVEDSNAASFAYTYTSRGTYEAKLTVSNANGTDTETAVITVMEEEIPILPVANFTVNKTSGYYPLTVLFTDTSQNATGLSWDVNGDGVEDSNAASFAYTYTSRGTYEAKLTASNANGTDTETATIDVVKKSSSGSSGGGGGGGGSPEPAKNVKVKELAQVFITNGKAIKFEFKKNATCIVYVGFDAKKNAGKTTTIVEELKGKSSLVSELPAGEVYKSFNVWVGNSGYATSKNIENPVICFKVENTWIEDENVDKASITLNRYSDKKWEQLPAKISGEDDTYLYFTSDVPGFSSFAITGTSTTASEIVTGNGTSLETRALQDDGNESTDMDTQEEQEGSTKFSDIPPVYGIIGIFVLGLICVIIYLKLPK